MHWYTSMNTLGRPVEQLALCLASKQKSAVEVKVQQLCAKPARSAYNKMMSKGHAHTQQDNGRVRAFRVQNYSMCIAKVFIVCCQTVRSMLQDHSMRVVKAFNLRCKTIRSVLQNHSICVAKPFNASFLTIRSTLPNHSIRVSKPFDPGFQTIRSALQNHSIRVAKPFDP